MEENKIVYLTLLQSYDGKIKAYVDNAATDATNAANTRADGIIGSLADLTTTNKTTIVASINEVKGAIDSATETGKVTLTTAETATEGYLKTYVISQGSAEVGKIDIPKDLVVKSGEIVENPEGQEAGTYIKLVIANNEETPIYINVKNLIDVYKGEANATSVQVTVDGYTIKAEVVNGSITNEKIADATIARGKIDAQFEADIKALETAVGEGGNVSEQISSAIGALDYTDNVTGDFVTSVSETDGKITVTKGNFTWATQADIDAMFPTTPAPVEG